MWNNGLQRLCHVVRVGEDPIQQRPRLVREFVQCIVNLLFKIDSTPTLSRFFTFRACVVRMLTMHMIGLVKHAFQVRKVKPRKENQKRLKNVHDFFRHPEAGQTLRRTSLALQLTSRVEK